MKLISLLISFNYKNSAEKTSSDIHKHCIKKINNICSWLGDMQLAWRYAAGILSISSDDGDDHGDRDGGGRGDHDDRDDDDHGGRDDDGHGGRDDGDHHDGDDALLLTPHWLRHSHR
ncbi:hypothetical protein CDAR_97381 [Caerostris darwini]|uniref:Uncharacterized protein n=1 Tax=Caerostris darwini TaxID=1538125 RepID=A0AAV4PSF2_9ARAC|nr:hypothetical protein CDAR_97381 [Caerostris darwini]